jgi:hypothetical protein
VSSLKKPLSNPIQGDKRKKGGTTWKDLIIILTEGYLNQLLLVDALAAYMRMKPDKRSIKESAMVANSERDFEEMAAYNCNKNNSTLTPTEP